MAKPGHQEILIQDPRATDRLSIYMIYDAPHRKEEPWIS